MENKIVKKIKNDFLQVPDFIIKKIKISFFDTIYVLYLETVSSGDRVNDYILKNLSSISSNKNKRLENLNSIIPAPNTKVVNNKDEIEFYITNGFTVIIYKSEILAIETRADIHRSITESGTEASINGPKDSFTENYQVNIGLIKRRLKSKTLKTIEYNVGRKTNTKVGILYFEDITKPELVNKIAKKIETIDIDGILDASSLGKLLQNEKKTHFPTFILTERPDNVARALLEGKLVITMDTSPFCIILPGFFADFINPGVDTYQKSNNITFLKLLRLGAFFISMIGPALYIALVNYNQESIPTDLLVSFSIQTDGVPFPAVIEAIIMLIVCEMLRESDLRFPNSYGSAISILGALVLGEAAVSAGIVSPIMIIVVALAFMSSLIFTEMEIVYALRHLRFIFIFLAAFYGILGIVFGFIYFLIRMADTNSFGYPYFYPVIPFSKEYFFKTILKKPIKDDTKRDPLLSKNHIKQGDNL